MRKLKVVFTNKPVPTWHYEWRPVKPPKERKQTWYSAAVCLPRSDVLVEVKGYDGTFTVVHHDPEYIWRGSGCPNPTVKDTDEWRPEEDKDANKA
jgi:hypothetical protein